MSFVILGKTKSYPLRKILLLLIFGIAPFVSAIGQCCPYLGIIEVFPDDPLPGDSIYLATDVTTPALGEYLGYNLFEADTLITVEACYYSGAAAQPQTYKDTINLGVKDPGQYTLDFIAYQSDDYLNCVPTDTNTIQIEFEVNAISSADHLTNVAKIDLFPNPATKEKIVIQSALPIKGIAVFDTSGKLLISVNGHNIPLYELDLSPLEAGIYFIIITDLDNRRVSKKIIKI